MGFNIGKAMSIASTIGSAIDVSSITSGINVHAGMSPSELPGLASSIMGKLNSNKSTIMNQISEASAQMDVESMVNSIDIEGKAKEIMSSQGMDINQINSMLNKQGIDPGSLGLNEGQINSMITSSVNEMMSNIGLDKINYG